LRKPQQVTCIQYFHNLQRSASKVEWYTREWKIFRFLIAMFNLFVHLTLLEKCHYISPGARVGIVERGMLQFSQWLETQFNKKMLCMIIVRNLHLHHRSRGIALLWIFGTKFGYCDVKLIVSLKNKNGWSGRGITDFMIGVTGSSVLLTKSSLFLVIPPKGPNMSG